MTPWKMMRMQGSQSVSAYASLNPSDKSSSITLSGSNLIASANGASPNANGIVRSNVAIIGKRYFEALISSAASGAVVAAGVATSSHSLTASLGFSNPNGWAMWGTTAYGARHNGVTAVPLSTSASFVFGFAVDQASGKMWISKDGVWLASGDPSAGGSPLWTDLSGTLYAAACPWGNGSSVTMRFNPASFSYSAPSGFSPIS